MKKSYLFLATAILALASCSENTYLGDQEGAAQGNGAISFGSNLPSLTRAGERTGSDAAGDLGYSFLVYATKTVGTATSNVFAQNTYSSAANANNTPYWVWYTASTANQTASNTRNWEYVGTQTTDPTYGTTGHLVKLDNDQTIKYWDYSASNYTFVAYKNTEGTPTITNYTTSGFTVTATAAQLAGLYVADKITLDATNAENVDNTPTKPATGYNKIGDIVQFTFRNSATKVRLGIYETINGYEVRNVKFYYTDETEKNITTNAYLTGTFNGNGTSSEPAKVYNVTYNSTNGIAEFKTSATISTYFDFGTFDTDADPATSILGTTSIAPTWATGSATYKAVMPNTDHVACMILKVDYELHNTTTGETIKVTGAKAAVPAAFMKWEPNHAYTYLFKISDNTNGTTGTPGTNPEGLYPITFDAVTIASDDSEGTITTVATPSITTYQEGSVTDAGIEYVSGKAITATVTTPVAVTISETSYNVGDVLPISNTAGVGFVNVYYLGTSEKTEADLQVTAPSTTPLTISISDNVLSFTPATNDITGDATYGYWAIQYQTVAGDTPAYAYKIIKVKKATT